MEKSVDGVEAAIIWSISDRPLFPSELKHALSPEFGRDNVGSAMCRLLDRGAIRLRDDLRLVVERKVGG